MEYSTAPFDSRIFYNHQYFKNRVYGKTVEDQVYRAQNVGTTFDERGWREASQYRRPPVYSNKCFSGHHPNNINVPDVNPLDLPTWPPRHGFIDLPSYQRKEKIVTFTKKSHDSFGKPYF